MSFIKIITLLLFISVFLLTGCSNKHDVNVTEVFKSDIHDNDAKMFTFSIVFFNNDASNQANGRDSQQKKEGSKQQGKGSKGGKANQSKQGGSKKKMSLENQMTVELEERLVERLEDTGYCRKGYFELNRSINRSIYTINGECSESATPEDRLRFPNKVTSK